MEVLCVLIALLAAWLISEYLRLDKGPWSLYDEQRKKEARKPKVIVVGRDGTAVVTTLPPPSPPLIKEIPNLGIQQSSDEGKEPEMGKRKALCKSCAYLTDDGDCFKGIPGAPKVKQCKAWENRHTKSGQQLLKEVKETLLLAAAAEREILGEGGNPTDGQSCDVDCSLSVQERSRMPEKNADRSQIFFCNFK